MAKLSIDSRKKDQIHYVASVDVSCDQEEKILKKVHNNNIMLIKGTDFKIPEHGSMPMQYRPVIIGAVRQVCLQVFFLQERAIDRSFWNVVWQLMNEQPV